MKFLNTVPDNIILDSNLLVFFKNSRKFIPFYSLNNYLYVFVENKQNISIDNFICIQKEINSQFFNEKIQILINYEKWLKEKVFEQTTPIRSIIDFILTESLKNNVSDIHFDVFDFDKYVVSFKIKTILNEFCNLTYEQYNSILIAFKIMSSLDTSKKSSAQSSSFSKIYKDDCVDFRFSTHPTFFGERFVIRVLYKQNIFDYKNMRLLKYVEDDIEKIIDYPNGLILFTGPTNSGKTTLIHSILSNISKQNVTIMTLEDPIEYRIPGIIQTNVSDDSFTFFDGMKSILRQDPDVIFLGEIRDEKTAKIAIQAALTGHKVLTTLHAYSIKGAIVRLLDFGVSSFLLAESLCCVVNQRLLRSKDLNSLVLLADSCFFNNCLKDSIRNQDYSCFVDRLKDNANVYLQDDLIDSSEIKRILGL